MCVTNIIKFRKLLDDIPGVATRDNVDVVAKESNNRKRSKRVPKVNKRRKRKGQTKGQKQRPDR